MVLRNVNDDVKLQRDGELAVGAAVNTCQERGDDLPKNNSKTEDVTRWCRLSPKVQFWSAVCVSAKGQESQSVSLRGRREERIVSRFSAYVPRSLERVGRFSSTTKREIPKSDTTMFK
jgi:hypothetical protein